MERKLHIGGTDIKEGWEILNALEFEGVDHVMNANDLSTFEDNTFSEVYASHVVEHFDFKDELGATLSEWNRVLKPGGTLHVSVPDMDILCMMFLDKKQLDLPSRLQVMTMMFGAHHDEWDFHKVGLNFEFLGGFLHEAGFDNIRRVKSLGLFDDTSEYTFRGVPISLNMLAQKKA